MWSQRGQVHAAGGEWEEARLCFQNALAIHPTHLDTIVQLGERSSRLFDVALEISPSTNPNETRRHIRRASKIESLFTNV